MATRVEEERSLISKLIRACLVDWILERDWRTYPSCPGVQINRMDSQQYKTRMYAPSTMYHHQWGK
jgi:hypothetical protein